MLRVVDNTQTSSDEELVRISVANLVGKFTVEKTGVQHFIGILNPTVYNTGKGVLYQAIGGAAKLTDFGRAWVTEELGGRSFVENGDARFVIPKAKLDLAVEGFSLRNNHLCEMAVVRELRGELCRVELRGIAPILTEAEVKQLSAGYRTFVLQPVSPPKEDTSPNAEEHIPTHRMFYIHDVELPGPLLDKILASRATRRLTYEELRTTKGGSQEGRAGGFRLANNLWAYC